MVNQTYNVDIIPGGAPVVVHLHQNDMIGREITLNLFSRNGDLNIPNSASAFIEGQKPDGTFFSYSANMIDSTVSYTITNQMAAVRGDTRVQCKIVNGNEVIMAANYIHRVQGDMVNGAPVSSTEVPGLVQQAQAAAEAAERAAENIDDNWFIDGANNTNLTNLTTDAKRVVSAINEVHLIRGVAQENDLNNVTIPGWYYIDPTITIHNMPVDNTGILEVYCGAKTSLIMQRFTTVDNKVSYVRFYGGAMWLIWKSAEILGFQFQGDLASNTDLNNIIDTGRYYLSDARSYTNAPTSMVWGQLEVLRAGTSGLAIMQRITGAGSGGFATVRSWERLTINGGLTWGEWKEVMFGVAAAVDTIPDQLASGLRMRCRKTGATVWIHVSGNASSDITELVLGTLPEGWIPGNPNSVYFNLMVAQPQSLSASVKTPAIFGQVQISTNQYFNYGQVKLSWLRTTAADGTWTSATITKGAAVQVSFTFIAEQ